VKDYTLAQVTGFLAAAARQDKERLHLAAIAARAAGQDDKDWRNWLKS